MATLLDILGFRSWRIETSCATIDELYERIKLTEFEAGYPLIGGVLFGLYRLIYFPEVDYNNQVQISGKEGKFKVYRATTPYGRHWSNRFRERLTLGASAMSALFGSSRRRCVELVDSVAAQLAAMRL